ncbi:MAG: hypothetical protein IJ646_01885, partial [Clostridia bacterium]|nr:hypothetical protein [Clostridia bacterium]
AGAARQAVGLTGVLYVAHVCIQPMLTLAAGTLATKVIAAVLEPLAPDVPAVTMIGQFGEVCELLLAICACAAAVTALLLGGVMAFVGRV